MKITSVHTGKRDNIINKWHWKMGHPCNKEGNQFLIEHLMQKSILCGLKLQHETYNIKTTRRK
jgi:hypothetical protein